jgi:hypothetical protein
MCNDMHDCSVQTGDSWLQAWVPRIIASPSYQAGDTVLVITWDEDDSSAGNHIPALIVSPYTAPGTRNGSVFNHYSLLRTTEQLLGITTYIGNANSAVSMRSAFGL